MSMSTAYAGNGTASPPSKKLTKSAREAELLALVNKWYDEAKRDRFQFEQKWYTAIAFYFGRHYVQWTNNSVAASGIVKLYEPPVPPWRARLVANKIKPVIRKELAKVVREKPQPFVIPASTDDDDLAAARAGEAIFDHVTRTLGFDKTVRRMTFWELLCGSSFIKDFYDPTKPDPDGVMGSICVMPVNPFELYVPNTQEEELEDQPYVIHELAKDPDWVSDRFGAKVQGNTSAGAGVLEQKFLAAMGVAPSNNRFVSVRECWVKPCKRFPKGAYITWTGEQILGVQEEWPFKYQEFPFTKFDHIPSGSFYGTSVIDDLIPLQKELNRTRSQIIEAKNRMSKPQLVAARGSIDASKLTSEPGLVVFYTPGFQPPQPIPLVPIPNYVIDELARCQVDMDDISGQHEISKGHAPPGVSAATAISFLQEQDDSLISPTITSLEEGVARIGQHILSHVSQFWEAERTVRTLGENNAYETAMFNRAAINGNTDLNIQAGSATPRSSAAKQAFIMEMMDKKYISPERGLRYLNMSETNRMYEEMQVSARQAQRENLRMAQGEEIPTNQFDEDEIHMDEHQVWMRRQAFESYPTKVKDIAMKHLNMHKQVIALKMGTPIAPGEQLPTGGDPGGGPPGGPPGLPTGPPPGPPPPPPGPGPGQ